MSQENTSSHYALSPMAEHPEHHHGGGGGGGGGGASEGTAAGLSDADMGSYGSKIVISRSSSMSPRTLARRQQERQHTYGSSGSDLRSLGGLSEVPHGGGGTGWGASRGPSRTTSGYSEARLTSASTLTSFNDESVLESPGAGARGGWMAARVCTASCSFFFFFSSFPVVGVFVVYDPILHPLRL